MQNLVFLRLCPSTYFVGDDAPIAFPSLASARRYARAFFEGTCNGVRVHFGSTAEFHVLASAEQEYPNATWTAGPRGGIREEIA